MKVLPLPFTTHTYFIRSLDSGTKGLTNLPGQHGRPGRAARGPQGKGSLCESLCPAHLGGGGGRRMAALSVPRGSTLNLPPPHLLQAPGGRVLYKGTSGVLPTLTVQVQAWRAPGVPVWLSGAPGPALPAGAHPSLPPQSPSCFRATLPAFPRPPSLHPSCSIPLFPFETSLLLVFAPIFPPTPFPSPLASYSYLIIHFPASRSAAMCRHRPCRKVSLAAVVLTSWPQTLSFDKRGC